MRERIVSVDISGYVEVQRWRWWWPFWTTPITINTKYNNFYGVAEALQNLEAEKRVPFKRKTVWKSDEEVAHLTKCQ